MQALPDLVTPRARLGGVEGRRRKSCGQQMTAVLPIAKRISVRGDQERLKSYFAYLATIKRVSIKIHTR